MIIYQHRIYRIDLQNNPDLFYVFGDNLLEVGMGGQAGEMRGEPNALGIPTKKRPGMNATDFFTDCEYEGTVSKLLYWMAKFAKAEREGIVVVPADGIGTGLSEMPQRCPRLFKYLCAFGLGGPNGEG